MRIIFFGGGGFGCESLTWLSRSPHEILEVITQPARPAGRGRQTLPTPIAQLAQKLHLPFRETPDINDDDSVRHIHNLKPDLILVIAFGQKIGPAILNTPHCRIINLHGSLLPQYRGAAPINWAIINGETRTGLTVIELNEQWDAGNILATLAIDIRPDETAGDLHDRLAALGPQILSDVLTAINNHTDHPQPQDPSRAGRAPKLKKDDGAIHWDQPAQTIYNQIRGMWPWPGAYCQFHSHAKNKTERITLIKAKVIPDNVIPGNDLSDISASQHRPGSLAEDFSIYCGDNRLQLLYVRPDNSKPMDFADFVNGRHLQREDCFLNG